MPRSTRSRGVGGRPPFRRDGPVVRTMPPIQGRHGVGVVELEGQVGVGVDAVQSAPAVALAVGKVRLVPFRGAREAGQPVIFLFLSELGPGQAGRTVGAFDHPVEVASEQGLDLIRQEALR